MSLSQQDLNVRLQKIGCCTGEQAKLAARYYLYGSECAEEQLQKLTLLNAYLDILSCYNVQSTTNTDWYYEIDFSYLTAINIGDVFKIYINGQLILDYTTTTIDKCSEITSMVNLLLANPDIISVVSYCNISNAGIRIKVGCDMILPYCIRGYGVDDSYKAVYLPIYTLEKGKCITGDADNCITEAQVEVMLENIAIMCKDCFKPNGFGYY